MLAGAWSWLLFIAGLIALALGTAAVFLPRLDPLPFLLLSLLLIGLSSRRFYRALLWREPWGPPLRSYLSGRGLSRRAKAVLLALVFAATLLALLVADSALVRGLVAAAALAAGDHVLAQPTAHERRPNGTVSFG